MAQTIVITPFKELHKNVDISNDRISKGAGSSKYYRKSEAVPAADQDKKFGESLLEGVAPFVEFEPDAPTATYSDAMRTTDAAGNPIAKITIQLSGEAGTSGLIPGILVPNIDYEFKIEVNTKNPNALKISVEAKHNEYPALEFNFRKSDSTSDWLYRYKPADTVLPGPNSLNTEKTGAGEEKTIE